MPRLTAECEYEATPVNFEQWGPMKPTTPNGQLPIFTLEVMAWSWRPWLTLAWIGS